MKYQSVLFFVLTLMSCNSKENNNKIIERKPVTNMSLKVNLEIEEISERLKEGMIDFITPGETSYSKNEVETCMNIIAEYLQKIEKVSTKDEAMKIVKKTVISLNHLNEKCDYELIETDQREDIAEIIILAGSLKGFNTRDEDITEDWREW